MEQSEITAGELDGDRLGVVVKIEDGPYYEGERAAHVQGPLRAVTHFYGDDKRAWCRMEIDLMGKDDRSVQVSRPGEHKVYVFKPSDAATSTS